MIRPEISEILRQVEARIDAESIEEIKESVNMPWRERLEQWKEFLERSLPAQSFELNETVNGESKSYSFSMDLVRDGLVEQLLRCELEIGEEVERLLNEGNSRILQMLSEHIEQHAKDRQSKTWGELIKEASDKGFLGNLFVSKKQWQATPIRLDRN